MLDRVRRSFVNIVVKIGNGMGIIMAFIFLVYFLIAPTFVEYYFKEEGGYILLVFTIIYLIVMINIKEVFSKNFTKGFDDIKDLIRGTITVDDIDSLIDGYHHFRKTPGIEIIEVKDVEKLINLQNITVNFIFENRFIGEM